MKTFTLFATILSFSIIQSAFALPETEQILASEAIPGRDQWSGISFVGHQQVMADSEAVADTIYNNFKNQVPGFQYKCLMKTSNSGKYIVIHSIRNCVSRY